MYYQHMAILNDNPLLQSSLEPKLYLFPFMLPGKQRTELGDLYSRVKRVMVDVHNDRKKVDDLVHIADEW